MILSVLAGTALSTNAANLQWGQNASGGSGGWNTANWWNGTSLQQWTGGSTAVFGGPGGNVVFTGSSVTVAGMTFDSPGYMVVIDGSLTSGNLNFNLVANSDATLHARSINAPTISKTGAGTLQLRTSSIIQSLSQTISVNSGTLDVGPGISFPNGKIELADQGGATLAIPSFLPARSLSGGGTVKPAGGDALLQLMPSSIFDTNTSFGGALEDNGATGKLSLSVIGYVQRLTGVSGYSGTTSILGTSTLSVRGNGSILNTSQILVNGTLALDNSIGVNANRISDSTLIVLQGGALRFSGNSGAGIEESIGTVNFSTTAEIFATTSGASAAKLTIGNLSRVGHSTLTFGGTGAISANVINTSSGILKPYFTFSNEWAAKNDDGEIRAFSNYVTDINSATASSHVKIAASGITQLAESATRATLNFQNAGTSVQSLDLNSHDLTLGDGGILSSGSKAAAAILNGRILAAQDEFVVTNRNDLTVSASIVETGASMTLTKSGAGTLTLTGANSYTGDTFIQSGLLVVGSDSNLGTGARIVLNGGNLKTSKSFTSPKGIDGKGTIDIGANDVAFLGVNAGVVNKTGTGKLTLANLTASSSPNDQFTSEGSLALPNANSGRLSMTGNLDATGTLNAVAFSGASTLEIGGNHAAELKTETLQVITALTIFFDLGETESDYLEVTANDALWITPGSAKMSFTFRDIGGATTNTDYLLIRSLGNTQVTATNLDFSAESLAAGWSGDFVKTAGGIYVRFTSVPAPVPEPTSIALLALGIGGLLLRHKR